MLDKKIGPSSKDANAAQKAARGAQSPRANQTATKVAGGRSKRAGKAPADWQLENLQAFLADPGAANHHTLSTNLSQVYAEHQLGETERRLAEDILRNLKDSLELRVRQSLSDHLKSCHFLPHDIARALAEDVESVALPMLEFSEVLSDRDLVEIVRSHGEGHQLAVTKRAQVSAEVSEAIVEQGHEAPVASLLSNKGADITEDTYDNVITLFPKSEPVHQAMAARPDLSVTLVEKLTDIVSEALRFELVSRNAPAAALIETLMRQGGEGATLALLAEYEDIGDAERLAMQLFNNDRLSTTLLLRALYLGQLDFFEFALARLTQMKVADLRTLLNGPEPSAFKSLYRKARLPAELYIAFSEALDVLSGEIFDMDQAWLGRPDRRRVSALLEHPEFDLSEFEAALHVMGTPR